MGHAENDNYIVGKNDVILVTGAAGFIGSRLVECLQDLGFPQFAVFHPSVQPKDEDSGRLPKPR